MELRIVKTNSGIFYQTEKLTRETFWNLYKPGCDEHLVLHQLRKSDDYIEDLDLTAIMDDEVIGHIISSRAMVMNENGKKAEVLCVGPITVAPSLQNKGIGTKLLNAEITLARAMRYKGMILFGNPDYYKRFGFVNAEKYAISTKDGQNFDPFMALELKPGALNGVNGQFYESEAFAVEEEMLAKFEKKFPEKKKGQAKIQISM
jgi:predicted N-acetyltransferase YhbS